MKPRIVLAGGSGFIGESLLPFLISKNYEVIALTRAESHQRGAVRNAHWDGKTLGDWIQFLNGAAVVVNLTGRSIDCRHTPEHRREIIYSRVDSVRVLGQAMGRCAQPPQVFVQIAGVGIYGDKGERICDETTASGDDFVTEVCQKWEAAFDSLDAPNTRKVLLRLGVVLGPERRFSRSTEQTDPLVSGWACRQWAAVHQLDSHYRSVAHGVGEHRESGTYRRFQRHLAEPGHQCRIHARITSCAPSAMESARSGICCPHRLMVDGHRSRSSSR